MCLLKPVINGFDNSLAQDLIVAQIMSLQTNSVFEDGNVPPIHQCRN
jgi:hypothetical protein